MTTETMKASPTQDATPNRRAVGPAIRAPVLTTHSIQRARTGTSTAMPITIERAVTPTRFTDTSERSTRASSCAFGNAIIKWTTRKPPVLAVARGVAPLGRWVDWGQYLSYAVRRDVDLATAPAPDRSAVGAIAGHDASV